MAYKQPFKYLQLKMQPSEKMFGFFRLWLPGWQFGTLRKISLLALLTAFPQFAQLTSRYALILTDKPIAERFASREQMHSEAALALRQDLETAQQAVRAELGKRNLTVTGSASTLLNAVFVRRLTVECPNCKPCPE